MTKHIIPVAMSGGVGSRLWPMSRRSKPKQMQALTGSLTMLQDTLDRVSSAAGDVKFGAPIIVANQQHSSVIAKQLTDLGIADYTLVLEPRGRNTAPVVAIAAELASTTPDAMILVLPADHHIKNVDGFRSAISKGAELAVEGKLVTFGIQPSGPETGFGYIRAGDSVGEGHLVDAFVEKPDATTAQQYLDAGNYFWNAGIFLFRADSVLNEMNTHCQALTSAARAALGAGERDRQVINLDPTLFDACPSDSFDYAVMEKTAQAAVVPMDVGWSDVGSWNALWGMGPKDEHGIVAAGDVSLVDCQDMYVRGEGIRVAAVGVSGLVIVATKDSVLVLPKERAQDVKAIVERLEAEGRDELL